MDSRRPLRSAARRNRCPLAVALGCVLGTLSALPAGAMAQDYDLPVPARLPAGALDQTLYLDIVLDGQVVRTLVAVAQRGDRLSIAPDELRLAGLELPVDLGLDAEGRVDLYAVPGLNARFDAALQQLVLTPDHALRPLQSLGYVRPGSVKAQRDSGLRVDWDAYGRSFDAQQSLSIGTATRWFGRWGTFETLGVTRLAGDGDTDAYTRLDTRWTYSDPERLATWTAGDLVSGGLNWTRPVRMGGLQWRRNFGVRPDLIVYPVPRFSADATVPSSVELFVDNVRQYSQNVDAGPFVLTDFPRVVGAGQAVIVVTDALGRTTQTSVPLYVDYQRLAPGLSDFSVEAGLLRTGFGAEGDEYGNDPVASASWRRGLTDTVTMEAHGEYGPGLRLGGAGIAWSPANRFGVVSGSVARSAGDARGTQIGVGYQWFGGRFGFDAYTQRADAGYRDIGSLEAGSLPLREQDRATASMRIPYGSVSLAFLRARDFEDEATRVLSAGLSQTWGRVALTANAFHDARGGTGVSMSVNVPLGPDINASLSADRGNGDLRMAASLRRSVPYEGGWGWDLQARDDGDAQASATYRARVGEVTLGIERVRAQYGAFAQGFGSVVWMDGQAFASRRIGDSFAVVSTAGVGGVPILFENRVAGTTNDAGYLLIGDLRGWQRNRMAIDPDALSADVRVPAIERLVTPADNSGVRVRFDLQRVRSVTVLLHQADGTPVAAGTRVNRGDGSAALVGFDGELWLESVADAETLRWSRSGAGCSVTLPALAADATRAGPLVCRPSEGTP